MTFKKDYINYLLYSVVNSRTGEFRDDYRLKKLVDSIISIDDEMKITFLIGKTAGLEALFKYLLYISDKIDKSKVTVFNLKDNFEYDVINLTKICRKISEYKGEYVQEAINNIAETEEETDTIKIEVDEAAEQGSIANIEESEFQGEEHEDTDDTGGDTKLTLIENTTSSICETKVFELESISDSVENADTIEKKEAKTEIERTPDITDDTPDEQEESAEEPGEKKLKAEKQESEEEESDAPDEKTLKEEEVFVTADRGDQKDDTKNRNEEDTEDDLEAVKELETQEASVEELPEIEIEIRTASVNHRTERRVKEESVTSEAYYKFESKFFEEVKILEKLFAAVDKDCRIKESGKLSEKCLQRLTEIIEISSELSNLSRQLSFDLIADIFFTMNIYFTKAISMPELLTSERIMLLDSSLALVNSLIKGEDYLNFDTIADKIEELKSDISKVPEEETPETPEDIEGTTSGTQTQEMELPEEPTADQTELQPEIVRQVPELSDEMKSQMEAAGFKLK